MEFIDDHKEVFGVEPICRVLTEHGLPIASSIYYEARNRQASRRAVRDEQLRAEVSRVHRANYGVYGARKVWMQLNREGTNVAPLHRRAADAPTRPGRSAAGQEEAHHHR